MIRIPRRQIRQRNKIKSPSDSRVWGPSTWYVMHQLGYSYLRNKKTITDTDKTYINNFYTNLLHILPCPSCREHYNLSLKKRPINNNNDTPEKLFKWTVDSHNAANKGLRKKVYTYQQAINIHKGNINNNIMSSFIFFLIYLAVKSPLNNRKKTIESFIHLYPDDDKKNKLIEYLNNNPLNKIENNDMKFWSANLIRILNNIPIK